MPRKASMKSLMDRVVQFSIAELREHSECYKWRTQPEILALLAQVSTASHDQLIEIVAKLDKFAARHTKR